MGKWRGASLVICVCLACACVASAAPAAAPPKLSVTAARAAALAKAGRFEESNPQVSRISFEGCERRSPYRIRCEFYGRGDTRKASRACVIAAIVRGVGGQADATLQVHCKRVPRVLTIGRATPEIESVAKEVAEGPVVLVGIRRIDPLGIEATATWGLPTTAKEECEARFVARLNLSDELIVTHASPVCAKNPNMS
jgi:hypothetical protein